MAEATKVTVAIRVDQSSQQDQPGHLNLLEISVEGQTRNFKTSSQKLSPKVVVETVTNLTQNSLLDRMVCT